MASSILARNSLTHRVLRQTSLNLVLAKTASGRRSITSSEVTTALRPFLFLVHPDLFGKFPREQAVNQRSIQQLKCYVDALTGSRDSLSRPEPTKVMFYLRPSSRTSVTDEERSKLKYVTINLESTDIKRTINGVLKQAELPTSFVDTLPDTSLNRPPSSRGLTDNIADFDDEQIEISRFVKRKTLSQMDVDHPLDTWLAKNVDEARQKIEVVAPIALKTERIKDEICNEFGIKDVTFTGEWLKYTRIKRLNSLRTLLENHKGVIELLHSKEIIFSDGPSGITTDGRLAFYAGEVLENWLWHIRQLPFKQPILESLPRLEKSVSQSLRDISIVRRSKIRPLMLAEDYKFHLKQLLTSLQQFSITYNVSSDMPMTSLKEFEMLVEPGESPLMLSPSGQFIVPCNVNVKRLISYINENVSKARKMAAESREKQKAEDELIVRCISDLGLVDLRKADGISSERMIECCVRLLQYAPRIRHFTHGGIFEVNSYYAVSQDGVMTIPHFWLEDEKT